MGAYTGKSPATLAVIEDAEWLANTGATLEEAARRVGRDPRTLHKILTRAGRGDLFRKLADARPGWDAYNTDRRRVAA